MRKKQKQQKKGKGYESVGDNEDMPQPGGGGSCCIVM